MVVPGLPSMLFNRFQLAGKRLRVAICHVVLGLFCCLTLQGAEVTATLNPASVPAGEGAQLSIKILNGDVTAIKAPEVPGLILNGPNQGRQLSIVNGVRTSATTLSYAVGSMTAGEYDIPSFTVTVDGAEVQTQAFKITVTPSAAQTPAGLPNSGGGQPPAAPSSSPGQENRGFLTVDFAGKERKHAWVGEIAPVRIQAWLPADSRVSLTAPLQPAGSSFTLHNLSPQPHQDQQVQDGKRYLVVTWFGGLSATKAGSAPPDLSMKISLQIPDPSGARQSTGDPFMDQFLGRRMIQKEVELRSKTDDSAKLEIRPLPKEGRPVGFEGAVGKFRFGAVNLPGQWKTGEPQQIGCEVTGEGNFNLLQQPALQSSKDWKSYSGQSTFAAKDAASFSGITTFRFNQVPRQAGPQEVHLSISYFDPDEAAYKTAVSPSQTVEVTGADLPPEPVATAQAAPSNAPPPSPALAPQRAREGLNANLTPLVWRRTFRIFLTVISSALLAAFLLHASRSYWQNPQRRAQAASEKALRAAMREADGFAARGDVTGFFAASRRALQVRLGTLWQRPAPAITLTDVSHRLPLDSTIVTFFEEADRQEFSPRPTVTAAELPSWRLRLEHALTTFPS